jgi:lipoprotein-anchoring transpeptidase ErfK/SrfK
VAAAAACVALLQVDPAAARSTVCATALDGAEVTGPQDAVAWRVALEGPTAVRGSPGEDHAPRRLAPVDASWLLVVGGPREAEGRCWLRVRLPWRPDGAAGWVDARDVVARRTPWRIVISTRQRTLTLFRAGKAVRTVSAVVGKPATPTPHGLFAVLWTIRWHPDEFLGSWVLELTAHSDMLRRFEGGDGTVAIHGRGGSSLLDPLGSARSHGCIRLANGAIGLLVGTIGAGQLPGTPVRIT